MIYKNSVNLLIVNQMEICFALEVLSAVIRT